MSSSQKVPPQQNPNIKVLNVQQNVPHVVKIAQLNPSMGALSQKHQNLFTVTFIILEQLPSMKTKDAIIDQYLVGDETACIQFRVWDYSIPSGFKFSSGDIYRMTGGHCTLWKGSLGLYFTGKKGKLERVGEFCMLVNEGKNMSQLEWYEDPATKRWIARTTAPQQFQQQT